MHADMRTDMRIDMHADMCINTWMQRCAVYRHDYCMCADRCADMWTCVFIVIL